VRGKYESFLRSKEIASTPVGIEIDDSDINPMLYPFQREIVRWAVGRGRAALFEDCGLGKTFQQLEWARLTSRKATLILTPLAVSWQTKGEAEKLGIEAKVCATENDCILRRVEHLEIV
jgi:superfamily II DNA or RNA helicase